MIIYKTSTLVVELCYSHDIATITDVVFRVPIVSVVYIGFVLFFKRTSTHFMWAQVPVDETYTKAKLRHFKCG